MSRPMIPTALAFALAFAATAASAQSHGHGSHHTHGDHANHDAVQPDDDNAHTAHHPASGDAHEGHGAHAGHAPAAGVQPPTTDPHAGHDGHRGHHTSGDHGGHHGHDGHGGTVDASAVPPTVADPHAGHAMPAAGGLPLEPIPVPTEADRAAAFRPLHHGHAHGGGVHSLVRINRFEAWDADPGTGQAWEGSAWIGGDVQRLWLRSEGEREDGRTHAADLEVLYGRATGPWWDLLAGVRHDFQPGPSRTWAAVGLQGLAPYKFEVSATAYLGTGGHSAFNAEIEYELLFTSRLILQPLLEVELHGRDDPQRGTGSGLSTAEAGLRLRYEITRRFAPYLGVAYERAYGGTAEYRRQAGEADRDTRWVAGVRWWF
ncbi:copper resistance protein B [Pseudoxanthomonas suwonensis]|uniref:Copper resistance protein CopB n=1 Tax=Pseudoxanthomonas suwonensis TaxID=314722 RepID=A0A0E3UND9_9GAMM|nr:copper resistance protein B [Pseudoxanthomonas suwonensis]AKC86875.1 copper resistance protein CopB [Pseudoxanthomonas suwonensis]